jgi:hypothetical protein
MTDILRITMLILLLAACKSEQSSNGKKTVGKGKNGAPSGADHINSIGSGDQKGTNAHYTPGVSYKGLKFAYSCIEHGGLGSYFVQQCEEHYVGDVFLEDNINRMEELCDGQASKKRCQAFTGPGTCTLGSVDMPGTLTGLATVATMRLKEGAWMPQCDPKSSYYDGTSNYRTSIYELMRRE